VTPVFIFGAGPQGRVVLDALRSQGTAIVGGFLEDLQSAIGSEVSGIRVFDATHWLAGAAARDAAVVVAIGNNQTRMTVGQRVLDAGCRLHPVIHASATVAADARIGAGSLVCMHAAVATGCVLGLNVVVNTAASVDHDSVLEDGAYVSPGVCTAGAVRIGAGAFVGAGAIVGPGVTIGSGAVVGAGSVVLDNLPARSFAYGTPARVHRVLEGEPDWARILGGRR